MAQRIEQLKDEYGRLNLLLKEKDQEVGFYEAVKNEKKKVKAELLWLISISYRSEMAGKRVAQ